MDIVKLRGKVEWVGDLDEMRQSRWWLSIATSGLII
jgi:hypothetical protein